jgi:uncharacterized protein YbjT (DUF2867 family)
MTILVTGATGTIGSQVVKHLAKQGNEVRGLSRNPKKAHMPRKVEAVAGDLTDTASLVPAFDGATAVHLITVGSGQPLPNAAEIVDLAAESGVRKATILRGGFPTGMEEALESSGMEWTFIQPVEFMAGVLEWAPSIRDEGVVREAFPKSRSAMVDESDVGSVIATVRTGDGHAGQTYTITGPEALTVPEKIQVIADTLGRDITYIELTEQEARDRWLEQGVPEEFVDYLVSAKRDTPEIGYTVLPTVEELTGKPARSLADWTAEHAKLFR